MDGSPDWKSIQEVRDWFSKPENQHDTKLWIIKWGTRPSVDRSRLNLIYTDSFCEAAIYELNRRKRRGAREDEKETEVEQ